LIQRSWGIAAIAFLGGVGGGAVFPILPVIGLELGISGFMVGLILSANRITRLGFNPVTGSVLDRFGARWPVAIGLVIEAIGTLMFSVGLFSEHPAAWFLVGRIVWGVGSSLLLVGALAAIMAIAPVERRGGMTARVRTAISLGIPAGLVIGGLVADQISNNAAFLVATALSGVGAAGAVFLLPDRAGADTSERTAGENRRADDSAPAGAWRVLLAMPTLRIIFAANALLFLAVSGVLLATVAVLVDSRGLYLFGMNAQGSSGLLMAVLMAARAATALASGRVLDRSTRRTSLLLPAMALVAAGFVALGQATNVAAAVIALLLIGAGSGGLTIPMITLLGDVAPRHLHGRALSIYQWSSDFGGALGPALGLELGRYLGYGWAYGAVGLAVLGMSLPLMHLARDERRRG